jgi:hypothetical protein
MVESTLMSEENKVEEADLQTVSVRLAKKHRLKIRRLAKKHNRTVSGEFRELIEKAEDK